MVEALTLAKLHEQVRERYDYDERRVVGIMMARYDLGSTKEIVEQNYLYWHHNTRRHFDIFWAGYGAYLADESPTKTVLRFPGNEKRVYFDLDAFIEIKDQLNVNFRLPYEDKIQLILVNYHDGQVWFEESLKICLEENLDTDYAKIREIMEFVSNECRLECEITPIARKLKSARFKNIFKGITLSDAIGTAIGIMGLI